jgi:hypothetical protein
MERSQFSAAHARPKLLRRLRNLRNLEWFNIPFLLTILSLTWSDRAVESIWQRFIAYLAVASLLAMGGWYWHLKLHQIGSGRSIASELAFLEKVRLVAPIVLIGLTVALAASWLGGLGSTADRWWATGFLVLGWAEYVNYFHVQLMHDTKSDLTRLLTTRRLRKSWLANDLSAYRSQSGTTRRRRT